MINDKTGLHESMMRQKIINVRSSIHERRDDVAASLFLIFISYILIGRFLWVKGTVLFGDFVPTLKLSQYLRVYYPLWSNRNSFYYVGSMRLPYLLIFYFPFYIVNAPAEFFFKFMIFSIFVVSGVSIYFTVRYFLNKYQAGRKTVFLCSLLSSFFYAFNPWVMDRIQHFFLLTTYSLLPLIFLVSFQVFNRKKIDLKRVLILALLCSIASTSPHSVFFLLFMIVSLYAFLLLFDRRQFVLKTENFALFGLLYFLVNAFWIFPLVDYMFSTGRLYPDYVLHLDDLLAFSRNSGLFNVFRLIAEWWPKVNYSYKVFPLNVIWVFASVTVPALGFLASVFHRKDKVSIYLSFLAVAAIFLAAGTRSPLPGFYEWLCFDAPVLASFGWLFRDPNKWTLLIPLAYSVLLALACFEILKLIFKLRKPIFRNVIASAFTLLLFSLTFVYVTPSATNYFEGPFKPVNIPSEVYNVNAWLKNDPGSYNVLWMPSYAEFGANWVYNGLSGPFELYSSIKPTFDASFKYIRGYLKYFSSALDESDNVAGYLNPLGVRYIIFHNDSAKIKYAKGLFQNLQSQDDLELVKHDGFVYVFENKNMTENGFEPYGKTMVVNGGFDKFVSLNALPDWNSKHIAVVFADQNAAFDNLDFDVFVLTGDLPNDVLPFFIREGLVISPFDFCRRYSPHEHWSRGSLSDLLDAPFHPFLREFGVKCWDFDYDRGVVFTNAYSARLNVPFDLTSSGNFSLFLRVFENSAGGRIALYVDGVPIGTVETRSEINGFVWRIIGNYKWASGRHVLTLENVDGLNSVNLVNVMPEGKALEIVQKFKRAVEDKDLLYVFEGESDMLREDASVVRSRAFSNGAAVQLSSGSRISRTVELVCDGNYSFAVRGSGKMMLNVDGVSQEISFKESAWIFVPVYLTSGRHKIEFSGLSGSKAELDVLWLLKVNRVLNSWEEFEDVDVSASVLNVRKIDPTRFVVQLYVNEPFMLHFSDAYDPAWTASFDGRTVRSVRVFGVANGFWIDSVGEITVTVQFQPQRWFYVGLTVSLATLAIYAASATFLWWVRKSKRKTKF